MDATWFFVVCLGVGALGWAFGYAITLSARRAALAEEQPARRRARRPRHGR